ncbi:uncharacterized protein N7482_004185 [Penicillium canariense]|uniref:Nucleoside phosphorylase domain-containing protein n=1 Tax=Penicillium canariense TaxID=189055 RepID=A0A9W9I646_9EURO|nr:uncharacterized protein N7482_004185 [Penicillium canariense]KAJ5168591.1 hypothetical protein N7482_004185 [Penicillium canariense]
MPVEPPSPKRFISTLCNMSLTHDSYTVAWICALPVEEAASEAMLDETHVNLSQQQNDTNSYTLGRLGFHNVAIACLPSGDHGIKTAAIALSHMISTFPQLKFCLMVGIAGGVPCPADIRLGDVVISVPNRTSGGVIQYDCGKALHNGNFQRIGSLNKPPPVLLNAITQVRSNYASGKGRIQKIILDVLENHLAMSERFSRPDQDLLFNSTYEHPNGNPDCSTCDLTRLVTREPRATEEPQIRYGSVASGNQIMKDAKTRDEIAASLDILCFEMEAAGVMDLFPSLVIRGISDYCDSHKSEKWQAYAALSAAAYTKELLYVVPLTTFNKSRYSKIHSGYLEAIYIFPRWLVDFTVIISGSPSYGLSFPRRIGWGITETILKCAYEGNVDGLKTLLGSSAYTLRDTDQKYGRTALHYAVMRNHIGACEFLVNASANIHAMDNSGMTPAIKAWEHILTERGNQSQLEKFRCLFSDIDFCDDMKFSHIHMLVLKLLPGDLTRDLQFKEHHRRINDLDYSGKSPLHWAATRGDFEGIKLLLHFGADVTVVNAARLTPLMSAASSGCAKSLSLLLDAGSDVHAKDIHGSEALYFASRHQKSLRTIILLLRAGAHLNSQNNNGHTALIGAAIRNHDKIGQYLLRKGANIDAKGANGEAALFEAIFHNSHQFLLLLLESSADYTLVNHSESTILHAAALEGDLETVEILLHANLKQLDPSHRNKHGLTAIEMIQRRTVVADGFEDTFSRLCLLLKSR